MSSKYWVKIPVILLLGTILILSGCNILDKTEIEPEQPEQQNQIEQEMPQQETPAPIEQPKPRGKTKLTISAVGDIMMHMPQINSAKQPDGSYDFDDVFKDVRAYIGKADIAIGNFETTISTPEKGYSGYPRFRAPEQLLKTLKSAGFDVLTTANNHSLDALEFGVENTLDKMDEYGILHTGTARTPEERDSILLMEKNDIKVGILSYTYGTNGMETAVQEDKLDFMVNYYTDFDRIQEDISRAKEAGADVVVACMHWGYEYHRQPNEEQTMLADKLIEAGADIIFGSHPHVLQPMERRKVMLEDGSEKEAFVIYSLGNFVSNQRERYRDSGVIVSVEIIKDYDQQTVSIGKVSYMPTWVYRYYQGGKAQYRILPVQEFIDGNLKGEEGQRIQAVWKETTELLGTEEFEIAQ